jgi:hypothetical protein
MSRDTTKKGLANKQTNKRAVCCGHGGGITHTRVVGNGLKSRCKEESSKLFLYMFVRLLLSNYTNFSSLFSVYASSFFTAI